MRRNGTGLPKPLSSAVSWAGEKAARLFRVFGSPANSADMTMSPPLWASSRAAVVEPVVESYGNAALDVQAELDGNGLAARDGVKGLRRRASGQHSEARRTAW